MKTLRTLGVTVVLGMLGAVLSLDCGGKSDGEAPPACPAVQNGACPSGGVCSVSYTDCHGTSSILCSCTNTQWSCPLPTPAVCPPPPACTAFDGDSCTTNGQVCSSGVGCAQGGPSQGPDCTCDGKVFHCPAIDCPPPMMCPPPATIHQGGSCSGMMGMQSCSSADPILDCNGKVVGTQDCFCSGNRWSCPSVSPPCAIDAGGGPG
jgi:hypothetical protein